MGVAPTVKNRRPNTGETAVAIDTTVAFNIISGDGSDGVDIDTVVVNIEGTDYQKGDSEFAYSGNSMNYRVTVTLGSSFSYSQVVDVTIDADSLAAESMTQVAYTFTIMIDPENVRVGAARVELYVPNSYDREVLTIQEDWVRQGVDRYTQTLELWYGRNQNLSYCDEIELKVSAGATNALGKEIVDNGYLSVKLEGESVFTALTASQVRRFGGFFSNTKKEIDLKLSVPNGADTVGYFLVELVFEIKRTFLYGVNLYGQGIYADKGNYYQPHPSSVFYRAYVFNAAMWAQLEGVGFKQGASWRGYDKQW